MSKLVMGYWDCPVCGSKEIRGDVVNCPSCGRARGDVQFYVKGYQEGQNLREEELNQFEQLDDEKAQTFSKNPDWYCSFCNSLNSDNAKFCGNCGSSREDSEANYFEKCTYAHVTRKISGYGSAVIKSYNDVLSNSGKSACGVLCSSTGGMALTSETPIDIRNGAFF